ncbi:Fic family protein [Halomonas cibimaris]
MPAHERQGSTGSLQAMLSQIDRDKARIDSHRPLPKHTAASLRDHLALEWTYNSNGIEGNTLTLRETKVVLEGITVGGKTMREHLEAINHRDAIEFLEMLVAEPTPISERDIKDLHALVLRGIDMDEAGRYHRENVRITGASTTPPDCLHVEEAIQRLLSWSHSQTGYHPIRHIAELHTRFVEIHPFIDGNGRTGRLLMNCELMKAGYPPSIIRVEERLDYYDALDTACTTGDYDAIARLVGQGVERSIAAYLELLEPPQPTMP